MTGTGSKFIYGPLVVLSAAAVLAVGGSGPGGASTATTTTAFEVWLVDQSDTTVERADAHAIRVRSRWR